MKYPAPEALCVKGVFQIQPLFLVHKLRNFLTINLKDKSFHNSMEWLGLYLQASEYFQIYSVQITGKYIL